jgi:hypothetical protein
MTDLRKERLQIMIDRMIQEDETITLRAIMSHLPEDFTHTTALTRPLEYKNIYMTGKAEQERIRAIATSVSKQSPTLLHQKIAKQAIQIEQLDRQVQILVSSHRAMLAAVGEMGGVKAWMRFYDKNQEVLRELEELRAIPSAEILPLPV